MLVLATLSMGLGCRPATSLSTAPKALFDPDGAGFYDTPWPSNARVTARGTPDWTSFPNPQDLVLLQSFLDEGGERPGFGTNSAVYFQLDQPIELRVLPTGAASLLPTSSVQLVDIDPDSDGFGERTPLTAEFTAEAGTYGVANLVAVAPLSGFPLRPATSYALVVTTDLLATSDGFEEAWDADGPWGQALEPLRNALPHLGIAREDVACATVFTTTDPLAEMERIARFLDERVGLPQFTPAVQVIDTRERYTVFRTDYTTPNLQHGEVPYANQGGSFVFRDDGLPVIDHWDPMRMSLSVPNSGVAPPEGWPVVIYLHGTGGSYRTFANSNRELEVGHWLAGMGVVGVGIDLPLHGTRGTEDTIIGLHSFNVVQPDSALHILRQGAADLMYLSAGLTGRQNSFTAADGRVIALDPARVMVMGHSQGGLTAAIALPWLGERLAGAVISGTGGLLAITAVERDEDFDFPELIRQLADLEDHETLTELHPLLGLVQSLVEHTDPVNYAPYWFRRFGDLHAQLPLPVLVMSGIRDDQTPHRSAEALAAAAGAPFAGSRTSAAQAMILSDLDVQPFPLVDNVAAWDGSSITAGLSQWDDGDHYVLFDDPAARDVARWFVYSALLGDPLIDEGPLD